MRIARHVGGDTYAEVFPPFTATHLVDGQAETAQFVTTADADWPTARLAEFTLFEIVPAAEAPEGQVVTERTLGGLVDGKVVETAIYVDVPLDTLKTAKLALVEAANLAHKTAPFPWDFGDIHAKDDNGDDVGAAGAQTLQVRDIEDEKNWLAAQALAAAAVGAGAGSVVVPMKCTANLWIQVTAAQAIQVLTLGDGTQLPLVQRQAEVLRRYGELKRAVADAADADALDGIDISAGWPA